jgi:hypothetical protein
MDYLAKFYKNKSEQLQEKMNLLENLLIEKKRREDPPLIEPDEETKDQTSVPAPFSETDPTPLPGPVTPDDISKEWEEYKDSLIPGGSATDLWNIKNAMQPYLPNEDKDFFDTIPYKEYSRLFNPKSLRTFIDAKSRPTPTPAPPASEPPSAAQLARVQFQPKTTQQSGQTELGTNPYIEAEQRLDFEREAMGMSPYSRYAQVMPGWVGTRVFRTSGDVDRSRIADEEFKKRLRDVINQREEEEGLPLTVVKQGTRYYEPYIRDLFDAIKTFSTPQRKIDDIVQKMSQWSGNTQGSRPFSYFYGPMDTAFAATLKALEDTYRSIPSDVDYKPPTYIPYQKAPPTQADIEQQNNPLYGDVEPKSNESKRPSPQPQPSMTVGKSSAYIGEPVKIDDNEGGMNKPVSLPYEEPTLVKTDAGYDTPRAMMYRRYPVGVVERMRRAIAERERTHNTTPAAQEMYRNFHVPDYSDQSIDRLIKVNTSANTDDMHKPKDQEGLVLGQTAITPPTRSNPYPVGEISILSNPAVSGNIDPKEAEAINNQRFSNKINPGDGLTNNPKLYPHQRSKLKTDVWGKFDAEVDDSKPRVEIEDNPGSEYKVTMGKELDGFIDRLMRGFSVDTSQSFQSDVYGHEGIHTLVSPKGERYDSPDKRSWPRISPEESAIMSDEGKEKTLDRRKYTQSAGEPAPRMFSYKNYYFNKTGRVLDANMSQQEKQEFLDFLTTDPMLKGDPEVQDIINVIETPEGEELLRRTQRNNRDRSGTRIV